MVLTLYKRLIWLRAHDKLGRFRDMPWWEEARRSSNYLNTLLRPFFRFKCSICDTPETEGFVVCENVICQLMYCRQCWETCSE